MYKEILDFVPDEKSRTDFGEQLCNKYSFIKRFVIGTSACNREIECYCFGSESNSVIYCGGFHGSEWITTLLLINFIRDISESLGNNTLISGIKAKNFLDNYGICIIPCVNPDGVEIAVNGSSSAGEYKQLVDSITSDTIHWQSNARGVDLNHNFNAGWEHLKHLERENGIYFPSNTRYGGTHYESESEVKALVDFCCKNNFRHAIAFHSQGEEIYWNYGENQYEKCYSIAKALSANSGYVLSIPEGLAMGGGFKDWFIDKLNKPAFTVEIGKGKNPLPVSDIHKIYRQLLDMLILGIVI